MVIRYDKMMEEALRGIVYKVLKSIETEGLADPHHFYVSFKTNHPGVSIPDFLKEKYPEEMTIVLQHQFWDLSVNEEFIDVTLSFAKVPCHLKIPFIALTGFADPSVEFGLQFHVVPSATEQKKPTSNPTAKNLKATKTPPAPTSGEPTENVVSIDQFRRKH